MYSKSGVSFAMGICLLLVGPVCGVFAPHEAKAEVRLPKLFGNGMVLQQQADVAIWGWEDAAQEVTVTLGASTAKTTAGADGRWLVRLKTPAAGGPLELQVKGKNDVKVQDVLVGEVWICSGQSNMEWVVAQSQNAAEEIAAAKYPRIRMIKVGHHVASRPQDDLEGQWTVCSPESAAAFSAVGYYFARHLHQQLGQGDKSVPIGMINSSWGGTICEAWTSREALEADEDFKPILERAAIFQANNPNQAAALFNGMLNPIIPYGIKGAIWYQGESNVSRAEQYRKLFPAMITDWRKRFGQGDFPFLFVQLAPFKYGHDPRLLAEQWESQRSTLELPNTGMAVTTDIGNVVDIHPANKQDVGKRLALWALARHYGKSDLVYSGPLYESMSVEGNKIRVRFGHVGGGLIARGDKPLSHFLIAGEDQQFFEAMAVIDGGSILVSSDKVSKPVAVRFAWEQTAEPNLFNKEGLPASPFRTDDFKLISADAK
jgi:sialate O-acetylesterase